MVTERETVFVLWVATSLVFLLLSGLIWPMYDMLPVWRWLAGICPSTWGVEGFVKMNANGASLSQVSGPYLNLWILAVVWWVLGYCSRDFREIVEEIAMLMCYEATRGLELVDVEIETPICTATVKELKGKKVAVIPILRAGLGMKVSSVSLTG